MTDVTVIILTRNEAMHVRRAIDSVQVIAQRIVVVDSGSTDDTVARARAAGADVLYRAWTNHADQFNWALDQIGPNAQWILRLDADEIVSPALAAQIKAGLPDVAGLFVGRKIHFMGAPVRHGGVHPVQVLRLFRYGAGRCENRWMDEHIAVTGPTASLDGDIIDDNRKPLGWWIAKHNGYASREVLDLLTQPDGPPLTGRPGLRRRLKQRIYLPLPGGLRAGLYFLYRYLVLGGILDGQQARAFHVLQGFWYRYLVDAKLAEVRRYMAQPGRSLEDAMRDVLEIQMDLPADHRAAA